MHGHCDDAGVSDRAPRNDQRFEADCAGIIPGRLLDTESEFE
jgi:hypothetical protein